MRKRNRKNEDNTPGTSVLRLTAGFLKKESKPVHYPERSSCECKLCGSIFLGDTLNEAKARRSGHKCPKG